MQANNLPMLTALATSLIAAAGSAIAETAIPAAPRSDTLTLHHRITIPERVSWGSIAVELTPSAWRVGHVDGPPASAAQLHAVLGDLAGIEIGGHCASWVERTTVYPCGFSIAELDFAGNVQQRYAGIAVDLAEPDARVVQASTAASDELAGSRLIAPVLDAPRLVTVLAPQQYLGDQSKGFGGRLTFNVRAVTNPLVPSVFERSRGVVILRTGSTGQPS